MFGSHVPSYSPDTSIKLHGVTSQKGKHVTTVRSSDLNHKQTTPSDVFTDTLSNCSHIQQLDIWIYNLISMRFWPRFQALVECHKMRSEVLKVVIMMLLVTLVQPLQAGIYVTSSEGNLPPPSPWWWRRQVLWNVGACLPDYTVPQLRISLVSYQFGVQKTNSNNFHMYRQ